MFSMLLPSLELIVQDGYGLENTSPSAIVPGKFDPSCHVLSMPWESWFQAWLHSAIPDLPPSAQVSAYELTLRFTGDEEIAQLNAQYRDLPEPTDVLSFASLENDYPLPPADMEPDPLYLGDIVIAIPTAQRQADRGGYDLTIELGWLAVHGFLHLLGWDHPDEESLQRMIDQQLLLLKQVGAPLPPGLNPV